VADVIGMPVRDQYEVRLRRFLHRRGTGRIVGKPRVKQDAHAPRRSDEERTVSVPGDRQSLQCRDRADRIVDAMSVAPLEFIRPREPKPAWLKVRAPGSENYLRLKALMKQRNLHTVCEEAHCPNIGECWHHGTATFMILGDICTRACSYCAVTHGKPTELDVAE